MTQRAFLVPCVAMLVLAVALTTSVRAQENDHETPSEFPGVWYKIVIDSNGQYVDGEGDGSGWYYYPDSDAWRMWFYNGPCDESRKGYLNYHVYTKAVDSTKSTSVVAYFGWTTPAWSKLNRSYPPGRDDMPTTSEESTYMSRERVYSVEGVVKGTAETIRSCTISDYNPEWICIEIRARNAYIYRGAFHECRSGNAATGACCNHETGYCYVTNQADCTSPFDWLGVGTTCDQCTRTGTNGTDFGDAPDDGYRTLLASNGARHSIVAGVYLGGTVDSEADGQPNATATGDNIGLADEDGVTFTSTLLIGSEATVEVTASTQGYLNAWIDFDGNGRFDADRDAIFVDQVLRQGVNRLSFAVPADAAAGSTYARFRFNTRGLLDSFGPADDGEVEDYRVQIVASYDARAISGASLLTWSQPPSRAADSKDGAFETGSISSSLHLHTIAADDWQPVEGEPVTGIHWWGTFNGWTEPYLPPDMPLAFHIGIWTDVPDPQPYNLDTFAHPGALIWETYCTNWAWAVAGREVSTGSEPGQTCFLFSRLLSQDQWFEIGKTAAEARGSKVYWLSIAALYDPTRKGPEYEWTWKLRNTASNSGGASLNTITPATGDTWPPTLGAQWKTGTPIRDRQFSGIDMAFQLTTFVPVDLDSRASAAPAPAMPTDHMELALLAANWLNFIQ
jgi:hypothetical protein